MTQKDSGQDFDPKHRIIGAIVVVALAVILIPMILAEREPPSAPPSSQTLMPQESPAEERQVAITKVVSPGALGEVEKPAEAAQAPNPSPAPAPAAKSPTAPVAKQPAAAPKPAPATAKAPTPSRGWVVQVGTFSNTANATRLEKKLRADGQPVLAERISLAGNKAVRLRVGPFADRVTAVKAQEHIQKDVGVKGVVLSYP